MSKRGFLRAKYGGNRKLPFHWHTIVLGGFVMILVLTGIQVHRARLTKNTMTLENDTLPEDWPRRSGGVDLVMLDDFVKNHDKRHHEHRDGAMTVTRGTPHEEFVEFEHEAETFRKRQGSKDLKKRIISARTKRPLKDSSDEKPLEFHGNNVHEKLAQHKKMHEGKVVDTSKGVKYDSKKLMKILTRQPQPLGFDD